MPDYNVITVEPHAQVLLIVVQASRLDPAAAAELEDEASRAAIDTPNLPFVLDISKVSFAPSVAIGVLVNLFKGFKLSNRKAFLVGPTPPIRGVLSVTRVDELIAIRPTLDAVLADI
jgi:anti-sigma B factor antagonist